MAGGALLLASCTSGQGVRPTTAPVPSPPLTTVDSRRLTNLTTQPWSRAVLVDERTLDVHYFSDATGCLVLGGARPTETAGAVTITLYVGTQPDATPGTCIGPGLTARTRVMLSAPLGSRAVLDGGVPRSPEPRPVERP